LSLWGPAVLWAGLIFFLSSLPDLSSGLENDFLYRKVAHMVEYAVLAALLWRASRGTWVLRPGLLFFFSFSLAVLYAASDEWHQSFVPGRGPSAVDVLIDGVGAFSACLFLLFRRAYEELH
jgi:VanZ family protein